MECVKASWSSILPRYSGINYRYHNSQKNSSFFGSNISTTQSNVAVCCLKAVSSSVGDVHKKRSSLESLFCYDKAIPEQIIEKPVGISLAEKNIGDNTRCADCQAKGAVLCTTCTGSGLYVDSILESQGIIVKVRCLGWRRCKRKRRVKGFELRCWVIEESSAERSALYFWGAPK